MTTVTRVQPYDHARLASDVTASVVAGGILAPGCYSKFQVATSFLFDQAYPGALEIQARRVNDPNKEARMEALIRNRMFVDEYADARPRWRNGVATAFPTGTYWP